MRTGPRPKLVDAMSEVLQEGTMGVESENGGLQQCLHVQPAGSKRALRALCVDDLLGLLGLSIIAIVCGFEVGWDPFPVPDLPEHPPNGVRRRQWKE